MRAFLLSALTALIAVSSHAFAAADDVCSTALSDDLSCLPTQASAYCTAMLQAAVLASTSTVMVTVTDDSSQTATVTSTIVTSVYITSGAVSTSWSTSTVSETSSTTLTTYTSAAASAAKKKRVETCDSSSAMSALSSLAASALSTACSCIAAVPLASGLSTVAVVTSTTTVGAGATTTVAVTGEVDFTVSPPATVTATTVTVTSTQTSVVALAAPSFTQVWGPEDGCLDKTYYAGLSLNSTITQDESVVMCEDGCAQLPDCQFVFVQLSLDGFATGIDPYYRCYYNENAFNVTADIECGEPTTIWGTAEGFSAVGRGTPS